MEKDLLYDIYFVTVFKLIKMLGFLAFVIAFKPINPLENYKHIHEGLILIP